MNHIITAFTEQARLCISVLNLQNFNDFLQPNLLLSFLE